jgi:large-conductance mechanosensitive channel
VPEEQLNDKIAEYAEYIKLVILALVIAAVVWFVVKAYLKRKKQDTKA